MKHYKFYFYNQCKEYAVYVLSLLMSLCKKSGHEIVDNPQNADYICVSLTSLMELDILARVRRENPKIKIIVGGHCSFVLEPLLVYADYINIGAGFDIWNDIRIHRIEDLPYIATKNKVDFEINTHIQWEKVPITQMCKNRYGYWQSIGCKQKCHFFYTSWWNKHEINPYFEKSYPYFEKIGINKISFISNEYSVLDKKVKIPMSDVILKDYIGNPQFYDNIRKIRIGVESPNKDIQHLFKKPINLNDVITSFEIAKQQKQVLLLFFMVGLETEEDWKSFIDLIPQDYSPAYRIELVTNYFEPVSGTPLQYYNLFELKPINITKIMYLTANKNCRIKFVSPNINLAFPIYRAILQRLSIEDCKLWIKIAKNKNDYIDVLEAAIKLGFEDKIKGLGIAKLLENPNIPKKYYKNEKS